jgi:hypothetical protein
MDCSKHRALCLPAAIGNRLLQDVELSLCASTDLTMAQSRLWMKNIFVEKQEKTVEKQGKLRPSY